MLKFRAALNGEAMYARVVDVRRLDLVHHYEYVTRFNTPMPVHSAPLNMAHIPWTTQVETDDEIH